MKIIRGNILQKPSNQILDMIKLIIKEVQHKLNEKKYKRPELILQNQFNNRYAKAYYRRGSAFKNQTMQQLIFQKRLISDLHSYSYFGRGTNNLNHYQLNMPQSVILKQYILFLNMLILTRIQRQMLFKIFVRPCIKFFHKVLKMLNDFTKLIKINPQLPLADIYRGRIIEFAIFFNQILTHSIQLNSGKTFIISQNVLKKKYYFKRN